MPGYELTGKTARQHASVREKRERGWWGEKSTDAHTRVHEQTQAGTHAHTHARKHAAAVTRVCGDRHGDQTTFCVLSCETPQEYCMTGSRDPGTVGVSCLCLTRILFIILFCNGGKKFAAKDQSGLIISTLAEKLGAVK